jgi:hypothetical protein
MPYSDATLALITRHIEEAEERIEGQRRRIKQLAECGYDTRSAQALLDTMLEVFAVMLEHQHRIDVMRASCVMTPLPLSATRAD